MTATRKVNEPPLPGEGLPARPQWTPKSADDNQKGAAAWLPGQGLAFSLAAILVAGSSVLLERPERWVELTAVAIAIALFGVPHEDVALDADDGAEEVGPFDVGEGVGGVEDADAALLLAVAPAIAAADVGERRGGGAEVLRLLMQSRLVVLELDDQVEPGISGGLECFFDSAGRRA